MLTLVCILSRVLIYAFINESANFMKVKVNVSLKVIDILGFFPPPNILGFKIKTMV